jgi:hypothetical protein
MSNSFEVVGNGYSSDSSAVFFNANQVKGADVRHFRLWTDGYANGNVKFMRQRINNRRFKKGLRFLEADLGDTLKQYGADTSNIELMWRLDFWLSYYVTWLFRGTDLSNLFWCDGPVWDTDHLVLERTEISILYKS